MSSPSSHPPFAFRNYRSADFEACMACFESNVPLAFTVGEVGQFRRFLLEEVPAKPETLPYFVLVADGLIIGCGGLGCNENQTLSLTWGMVHCRFHKKGFGAHLLAYRLQQSDSLFPGMPLRLDTTQYAVGFFEKYDFRTVKYTPDGYAPGMHRYDMARL